jgi:ribose transport system permease protein
MVRQSAVIIVIAIGQTLLMISGGIDLSVGSVLALSTVVAAVLHGMGAPPIVGALAAVATATLAGLMNGLVTTKARVPAFIATLGMMGMARGLALVLSHAVSLPIPDAYRSMGEGFWFFGGCVLIVGTAAFFCLARTRFGRHIYAVGGNREAARLSGVNVDRHMIKTFTINGLIVGIASILLLARLGVVASPTSGEGYELDSIAAAVIGGTSLFGGQGTVGGSLVGSLIMAVLRNGCDQLNIDVNWQIFVIGAMIILAVFYDGVRRRRL